MNKNIVLILSLLILSFNSYAQTLTAIAPIEISDENTGSITLDLSINLGSYSSSDFDIQIILEKDPGSTVNLYDRRVIQTPGGTGSYFPVDVRLRVSDFGCKSSAKVYALLKTTFVSWDNSKKTNTVDAKVKVKIPDDPTNLVATPSGNQIDLQWEDNSYNETDFRIYKSTNNIDFTYLGKTTNTTYSDSDVTNGTGYYYKVRALKDYCSEYHFSDYTNTESAIPADIKATAVNLSPESLEIEIGKIKKFTVTFEPSNTTNQNVTWSISNSSIANINPSTGEISGLQVGSATVTATSDDGGFTDQAQITVVATQPISGTWKVLEGQPILARDIAIAAYNNNTQTHIYAVAATEDGDGGGKIYKYNHNQKVWDQVGYGLGVKVAVGPNGTPWLINKWNQINKWDGSQWVQIAGSARDIAIGSDNSVYIVSSTNQTSSGGFVYKWSGTNWVQVGSGLGEKINVNSQGVPSMVNHWNQIYTYIPGTTSSGWVQQTGTAKDLAFNSNDTMFKIGTDNNLYKFSGSQAGSVWIPLTQKFTRNFDAGIDYPIIISNDNKVYYFDEN